MTVSEYLSELVNYGGEIVTRGEMLNDLHRVFATWTDDPIRQQMLVTRYMQGHESWEAGCSVAIS